MARRLSHKAAVLFSESLATDRHGLMKWSACARIARLESRVITEPEEAGRPRITVETVKNNQ